jgi:hypothetical protein
MTMPMPAARVMRRLGRRAQTSAQQQQQQQFAAAADLLSWPRSAAANFTQQLPAHPY